MSTIAAIATQPGGALGIVRVSGELSVKIVDRFFRGRVKLTDCEPNKIVFGEFLDKDGSILGYVGVIVYHAPNSYTGEDMVEIISHSQ